MSAPWTGKRHAYAGWVPNVHSHLSFSLIGAARGSDVLPGTVAYPQPALKRLVAVHQARQTDDFLAPLWWTRLRRKQALQDFVLIGTTSVVEAPVGVSPRLSPFVVAAAAPKVPTGLFGWIASLLGLAKPPAPAADLGPKLVVNTAPDAQGLLTGSILIFPRQGDIGDAEKQAAALKQIRRLISTFGPDGHTPAERLDALPGELVDLAKQANCLVTLGFALFRTGEARLWFEEDDPHGLPHDKLQVLARQAYFFLKDMVHHHVHHDAKSDQITPLVPLEARPAADREEHWRRATAWSLMRSVDALARRGKLQDLREAIGILAYADAFQSTLMAYRRRETDPWSFEANEVTYSYDYKHVRESLKVQLDQASARRANLAQMVVAAVAGCIAATSLLASTISAHNGVAGVKVEGLAPVVPGVADGWLATFASFYWLPALVSGMLLWFVSSQVLAEDRIGARRVKRRKFEQIVRGAANSVASRRGWRSSVVQRVVTAVYLVLLALACIATIKLPPLLLALYDRAAAINAVPLWGDVATALGLVGPTC